MQGNHLVVGRSYAFRAKRGSGEPILKIKLLEKVGRKGKIKVRFEDGSHPGLEEYVSTRQLVAGWGERKALLRDEERLRRLEEHRATSADRVVGEAAGVVLASSGEPGAYADGGGTMMSEDELRRIMDRAGVEGEPAELHPLAFRDRRGDVHLPLEAAVALARAFAATEPQTVITYVDDQEEEFRLRGNQPGERWWHEYLREQMPAFAIVRQWAGLEQEAEMLRREIARLRGLITREVFDLKGMGEERKARRLERALEGR